ncbi:glutamate--tRNA ligase [Clostridium sp. D2Q-11]|uniref:Glutamate--tRNA ligase n=1 Tax=Anaeromonas frigoriresistens TaxID=2683708 RepID=A0A942Z748_9FIRM|nr:glutamate--tRNA ligase [Anaeromonas frigoriresistens]MBS4536858.1 glutamate--tRNA ligase [Anaeromonas frigoriresistens]
MSDIRVRFAPSPTGFVHIGSLRTALYNFLFARNTKGKYILRIEDTDRTRFVEGAIENLIESMEWAGIKHDEGVFVEDGKVVQKGEYGPYVQSERLDIYKKYIDELIEKGHAYYCFCSKDRLDKVREQQKAEGKVPKYDGYCRSIDIHEAKERIANGEEYVVRLKLPANKNIEFNDLVRGKVTINTNDMDDQVLMKSDGFPTYHFAVVIDDHLMEISHVVRGEEWLPSTPKHVFMFETFGWEAPTYVHLPTVLNKDKKKLSKRQGDVSVTDFKDKGYLPEALDNYLALVGWSPESNEEIFSMEDLIKEFSFDRVSKAGGVFDKDKLNWINGQYIREASLEKITNLAIPYLIDANYISDKDVEDRYDWIKTMVSTVKENLSYIAEITEKVELYFDSEVSPEDDEVVDTLKGEQVPSLLAAFREELEEIEEIDEEFAAGVIKKIQKKTKVKGKNLFMPIRAILTGQLHGPEMVSIILVLGKQNILNRIQYVENNILNK